MKKKNSLFLLDGHVNIVDDDLPWGDTVKDVLNECAYSRTWGTKHCCDYEKFDSPYFIYKLRDKYFCDKPYNPLEEVDTHFPSAQKLK
uniref:Uncharacterized protein n=1 Tax=Strongyloides venezuelensis TaxID=75913 RepID=A0A0K0FNW9_STRVS